MPNATPVAVVTLADAVPVGSRPDARGAGLRRDPAFAVSVGFLTALALAAVFAHAVAPYDPSAQLDIVHLKSQAPSLSHWFGTDPYSRDVLSRVIEGARVSLAVSVLAVALASVVGMLYGAIAGFSGGILDSVMMRIVDSLLAMPRILLLLFVVAFFGSPSTLALILLFGGTAWFPVSRLVRGEVLVVRDRAFVAAARALGASPWRILSGYIVPQVWGPVLVSATLGIGYVIVGEAGLSFLGHGIQPPQASWGSIIYDGRSVMGAAWWISFFPGLALVSTVLAANVVADRLRGALNPRQVDAS